MKRTISLFLLICLLLSSCAIDTGSKKGTDLESETQTENIIDTEPETVKDHEPTQVTKEVSASKPELANVVVSVHGSGETVSLAPGTYVWLSATGKKFHNKNDCGNMNPNKARQVTVEQAVSSGYRACEKCY